jgi:glutaminase
MARLDYQRILEEIRLEVQPQVGQGRVADYIAALGRIDPAQFGMCVRTVAGDVFAVGDADKKFSIQSISKVFTVTMALRARGDGLWQRLGREPSGNPFNSLVQLEYENGIPRNPFINAGALVLADVVLEDKGDGRKAVLEFVRSLCGSLDIEYDSEVAESEKAWGDRNAALAHFLKSFGNLRCGVADVLDVYFHQCSLSMSCVELARAFQYLAHGGCNPNTGERLMTLSQTKRTNALMLTCGVYDAAGDFAYRVGLPGKSGVGGGIVAVMPGHWCVSVWSPGLNASGNSLAGTLALELFTSKTGVSIF